MAASIKQREDPDWKPEIRLPNVSEYLMLTGLEWDTEYDVFVVAENQQGKSKPGTLTFKTSPEPAATTGNQHPSLSLSFHPSFSVFTLAANMKHTDFNR